MCDWLLNSLSKDFFNFLNAYMGGESVLKHQRKLNVVDLKESVIDTHERFHNIK